MIARTARIALVAVLAFSLAGCSLIEQFTAKPSSTPTGEQVSAELEPFYSQVLVWSRCGDGMGCTTAKAPLDWSDPSAGSIELALIRHKATGTAKGSLLVNPGGPGASGYDLIHDSLDFAVGKPLVQNYDIVGFDPRGVGRSTAIVCYDAAGMDKFLYTDAPGAIGSDEFIAGLTADATDFHAACEQNSKALLDNVDTPSAARDMDMMRAVLGDTKLNYLGYSYGTLLGSTYAELFPTKVGRLVLDGAIDPAASETESTVLQAKGFEGAIDAYLADCLTNTGETPCPFGGTVPQAKQDIADLLTYVKGNPIENEDGRLLNQTTLLTAIIYPLYSQDLWTYLSQMFTQVEAGDARLAFALADSYNDRGENGKYSTNSTEARIAINCLDDHGPIDRAAMDAEAAQLVAVAPLFGQYFAYGDTLCSVWTGESKGLNRAVTATGSDPIIVVGTTNDPATPYSQAVALAAQLENGHLISYTGEGHTAYNKGVACVDDAVNDYFVKGTVPAADPMC